ncbi:DUF4374 domain-containing protein [uncultured Mucilaginibacter sp.]|uniref:DUF4374 domain-containing protein n=1 Tax=uncultured Mucilaginibacter sp. TaxID=797541 RepID=UPI0025CC9245|nr:DUF4374 domain-containing protein [uncultured Mucilaginibacter sp.]
MLKFLKRSSLTAIAGLAFFIAACTSCSKDNSATECENCNTGNNGSGPQTGAGAFTVASWTADLQYVASVPSLTSGSLTFKGKGLEANGSRYIWHKQYVYLMNLPMKRFIQYEMGVDGSLKEKAYILTDGVVPNYFQSLNIVNDNTMLVLGALEANSGTVGWARINLTEFKVEAKGTMAVPYDAAKPSVNYAVGRGFVDNGKFIVGGYFYNSATAAYDVDGVRALVYDYPAMTNMRVIKTNATAGGVGYDYLSSLTTDEEGNHYFVASAGKFWTGTGGKSGVVRIKKGAAEFDPDYFLDVTTPLGKQACLMGINYVSNGIAIGSIQYEEMMTSVRDRLKDVGQLVKLDLRNKTATLINTPLSPVAMVRSPLVYGGKYYTSISPVGADAAIYEVDPASGSFKRGLALDGGGSVSVQLIAPHPGK